MVGRAAFVFPLSWLMNFSKKSHNDKVTLNQQVVIWWVSLMRGAVSIALANNQFTRVGHTQLRGNAIMITICCPLQHNDEYLVVVMRKS
ncbi:sodium/hydrogen exchanger 1-like [Spinacia oleracea]|uniref:Sodium/hydrogen exchanger 1-like n=1 Tax=Spinacia oleracea TaxID=3562 RepID=A0ABM3R024_SPIOL|nr:sodium/hydrogen exchanger 1-like [Spinacia oleracea]